MDPLESRGEVDVVRESNLPVRVGIDRLRKSTDQQTAGWAGRLICRCCRVQGNLGGQVYSYHTRKSCTTFPQSRPHSHLHERVHFLQLGEIAPLLRVGDDVLTGDEVLQAIKSHDTQHEHAERHVFGLSLVAADASMMTRSLSLHLVLLLALIVSWLRHTSCVHSQRLLLYLLIATTTAAAFADASLANRIARHANRAPQHTWHAPSVARKTHTRVPPFHTSTARVMNVTNAFYLASNFTLY